MTSLKNLIFLLFAWHIFVISSLRLSLFNLFFSRSVYFLSFAWSYSVSWACHYTGRKSQKRKKAIRKDEKMPHERTEKNNKKKTLPEKKTKRNNARRKDKITKRRQANRRKIKDLNGVFFGMIFSSFRMAFSPFVWQISLFCLFCLAFFRFFAFSRGVFSLFRLFTWHFSTFN